MMALYHITLTVLVAWLLMICAAAAILDAREGR